MYSGYCAGNNPYKKLSTVISTICHRHHPDDDDDGGGGGGCGGGDTSNEQVGVDRFKSITIIILFSYWHSQYLGKILAKYFLFVETSIYMHTSSFYS